MARPVSDEEISKANSGYRADFGVWGAWNLTHASLSHNQTYQDQDFLRIAWDHLRTDGIDSAASDNLGHFLSGTGTPRKFSLNKLFNDDKQLTAFFNEKVGKQISSAEQAYRALGPSAKQSLGDYLDSNLKRFDEKLPDATDLFKDYGPLTFRYHGHVQLDQEIFKNQSWKNTTGGLTVFWVYAGITKTSIHRQHRVVAWCLKTYKWHPKESTRATQLVHMAAENAKAPQVDTSYKSVSQGLYAAPIPLSGPTQGDIKLGTRTIGHWKDTDMTRQTVYNPAKEFKLVFEPVERIVPVYVKSAIGSATATTS